MNSSKAKQISFYFPLILLLLLVGGYYSLFLPGIPYEQLPGVSNGWQVAAKTPWIHLIGNLFSPFSAQFTATDAFLAQVRVTESLIHKLIYMFFGESMTALMIFHILTALLFAGLIYQMTIRLTQKTWIGFLTAIFLLTTPAYGWVIMEYGDYSPLDQVLLLVYFLMFLPQFDGALSKDKDSSSPAKLAFDRFLLLAVGMIAVHAKEPNKFLIPGVSFILLFFNPQGNLWKASRDERLKLFSLLAVTLLLACPIFFVLNRSEGDFSWSWMGPLKNVFFYPTHEWDREKTICLFTIKRALPVSVLSNFGFFLGWAVILCGIFLIGLFFKSRKHPGSAPQSKSAVSLPFFLLSWLVLSSCFYFIYDSGTFFRYISWALLPFCFLAAWIIGKAIDAARGKSKLIVSVLLIAIVIYTFIDNAQHFMFIRRQLESIWVPKWTFLKKVYLDYYQKNDVGIFDLYTHWAGNGDARVLKVFHYLPPTDLSEENLREERFLNEVKKSGKFYFSSTKQLSAPSGMRLVLLQELDLKRLTPFSRWFHNLKRKPVRPIYLYRLDVTG